MRVHLRSKVRIGKIISTFLERDRMYINVANNNVSRYITIAYRNKLIAN